MDICWVSWERGSEEKEPAEEPLLPQTLPQAAPTDVRASIRGPSQGQSCAQRLCPQSLGTLGNSQASMKQSPAPKVVVKLEAGSMSEKHSDLSRAVGKGTR